VRFTLVHVEAFLTLAEQLHFGRTAERLHLSQPQVSRLIASLEREIGAPLFERTSRRARLTPLGHRLADRMKPAYGQLLAAVHDARTEARQPAGLLRVGFAATAEGQALTQVVEAFEARHPDCRIALCEINVTDLYGPLRRGEIDILISWLILDEPDLTAGPVIDSRSRVLAVASAHPLAGRRSVSVEDLGDEEVAIMPQYPAALHDAITPLYTPSGRPVHRTYRVGTIHETASLVARGRVIHPTIEHMPLFRRSDIVTIPIRDMPPLPLGPIWCTAHENARIRAFAEITAGRGPAPS
jgi:DNA-binding transcriptional LysR family regulator